MAHIWQTLPKPIFCLAPMFGATDSAFRQLLCKIGKPDLMFTEFINVQAIYSPEIKSLINLLSYSKSEQPLICQLWGLDPEMFEVAADLVYRLGFQGIDINLGCPEKAVVKKGAGAALIDNQDLAGKIIHSTLKGARGRLPVSVKTRLGNKTIVTNSWFKFLLSQDLAAVSVHCRTAKELSVGPTHWPEIAKIVKLKKQLKSQTLIIGNGDIFSRETAYQRISQTQIDGVMIGRGVFHNPWIFNPTQADLPQSQAAKIAALKTHIQLYQTTWGPNKPIHPLKRFYKIYLRRFKGAVALRRRYMAKT
ncbi:MAG: tRNA-dihydrouridine synthase, partial [Candidatus Beckwithbacteria bacterium]